jgi:YesN/AraC family two-component response regulator
MVVKDILEKLGLHYKSVELGEADIYESSLTAEQRERLKETMAKSDLVLIEDKKSILIEKVSKVIIEMIHYADELPKEKYSVYISNKLKHDYNYLSNLFSEVKGTTIDKFIISHKIEKVKELLLYDELSIKEISYKLKYSSVAHLSNQFKKVTGQTPSRFKKQKIKEAAPAFGSQ